MAWNDRATFSELVGKTLAEINGAEAGSDEVVFVSDSGERFKLYHSQGCCESVSVNDVEGDLADLIGSPILLAEEATSDENPEGTPRPEFQDDSFTWTFYRIATARGFVVIRWYGESNGYYSESVDFERA
jgi:hypothetical protein